MIVKTARKLEIGDELLPWANTDEEHDEFDKSVESARDEVKALPQGAKSITFLMKKEYKNNHGQHSKILYKRRVNAFNPKTGAPDYKDHTLKFNWGMIRTSNFEEIAFLDMHKEWFIRENNRELTPMEKMAKELEEAKAKLAALSGIEKQKEEIIKETEQIQQEENIVEEKPEPVKQVEVKEIKQRGRPKKS
jgi:hypothetical protein